MGVSIVADHGTHLLIANGERYAVIEQRAGKLDNCHGDKRAGIPGGDLSAIDQLLDESDWTTRETAEATFNDVVARGSQLAQRM
jgi:hypothetical protein